MMPALSQIFAFIFLVVPIATLTLAYIGGLVFSFIEGWDAIHGRYYVYSSLTGLTYTDKKPQKLLAKFVALLLGCGQMSIFGASVIYLDQSVNFPLLALLGLDRPNSFADSVWKLWRNVLVRLIAIFLVCAMVLGWIFSISSEHWSFSEGFQIVLAVELGAGVTIIHESPKSKLDKLALVIVSAWGMGFIALICSVAGQSLTHSVLRWAPHGDQSLLTASKNFADLIFLRLPAGILSVMWIVALPLAYTESWSFLDAFAYSSSAVSCGSVALDNAAPKSLIGHCIVITASSIGLCVLSVGLNVVSAAVMPIQKAFGLFPAQTVVQSMLRMVVSTFVILPSLILVAAWPLGVSLYFLDERDHTDIYHCMWFVVTVLSGGGMFFTDFKPHGFAAKLLVSLYSTHHVGMVSLVVVLTNMANASPLPRGRSWSRQTSAASDTGA